MVMRRIPRHKVFVSYHHSNDQNYKDEFERLFGDLHQILASRSVGIGDLHPRMQSEAVRQRIRDEYLRDSTVTVVLIGAETWKRKHVDWEIAASLRQTAFSDRSGLLGVLLPTYPRPSPDKYCIYTIPPRLHDNVVSGFAEIYPWSTDPIEVSKWIHEAFQKRHRVIPDNSYPQFVNNRRPVMERWFP